MNKFLTRKLRGLALFGGEEEDDAYLDSDLPVPKQARLKNFVQDAEKLDVARKQVVADTKWTKADPEENKVFLNFGTMIDFFDYSGVRVQEAIRSRDLTRPVSFGNMLLPANQMQEEYEKLVKLMSK